MTKSKLSLEKFKIAELKNQSKLVGGDYDDGGVTTHTATGKFGRVKKGCVDDSKRFEF